MADQLISSIVFIDIRDRERTAQEQLNNDIERLEARKKKVGGLSAVDQHELDRLKHMHAAIKGDYVDPLFAAARAAFHAPDTGVQPINIRHADGVISIAGDTGASEAVQTRVARVALVLGILQNRSAPLPQLIAEGGHIVPDPKSPDRAKFDEAFYVAVGRAAGNMDLAKRVLRLMADAVDGPGDKVAPSISTLEFARVVEKMIEQGVRDDDPNLKPRVGDSLDTVQELGADKPMHEISIDLPDLEAKTDYQVVSDNIKLMGPMIFASMFDELKAFQVVDKLIDMSQRGEISLVKGKAGTRLYNYWRQAPNRMNENERQTFYAMTLGIPTGQPGVQVNKDFQDLWMRFVSSISTLVRESRFDQLLRQTSPVAINQQQVKKAARDLAANMSLYGYGMAFYAAIDLQQQINEMIELLSDKDLMSTLGARDMWGVIDQIAQVELGGARNSNKYRTLATCGAIITRWLADHLDRLKDPTLPMITLQDVENPPTRPSGQTATSNPTDYDLVNACELWLADSAIGEDRVAELSTPRDSPAQPSRPIQIPSIARDLLDSAGLGVQMSAGNGMGRPGGRVSGNGRSRGGYTGY